MGDFNINLRLKYEQQCPDCGLSDFVEDHASGDLVCRVSPPPAPCCLEQELGVPWQGIARLQVRTAASSSSKAQGGLAFTASHLGGSIVVSCSELQPTCACTTCLLAHLAELRRRGGGARH